MHNRMMPQPSPGGSWKSHSSDQPVPWQQVLQVLAQLCQAGQTGSLYFVSTERHAGNFTLYDGRLVGARYACQREERALTALETMTRASYRFLKKNVSVAEFQALPETHEILARLGRTAALLARETSENSQPLTEVVAAPEYNTPFFSSHSSNEEELDLLPNEVLPNEVLLNEIFQQGGDRLVDPAQQLALEHLAKGYLGPVAALILRKQLRQTQDAAVIIQKLKQRIRDPQDAQRFEREAWELC